MGIPARAVVGAGKHRYCLLLDRSSSWRLALAASTHPRTGPQAHDHPGDDPSEVAPALSP